LSKEFKATVVPVHDYCIEQLSKCKELQLFIDKITKDKLDFTQMILNDKIQYGNG